MDKLLGIHEDGEAEEDVAGGGGGKAADVGGDEQGGGDRHQAGGHQLDGRVFPSWVVRYQTIGYNEVLPAALKASFVRAVAAAKSRIGSTNAEIEKMFFFSSPRVHWH